MKNSWFKKLIPHAVAVLIFLVVAFVYCKPGYSSSCQDF